MGGVVVWGVEGRGLRAVDGGPSVSAGPKL